MTQRKQTRPRPTRRSAMNRPLSGVMSAAVGRRAVLRGSAAVAALAAVEPAGLIGPAAAQAAASSLTFSELTRVTDENDHWPEGYRRQILVRWGDPIFPDTPAFDPAAPDPAAAARQFGYANDFTAFLPMPWGSDTSDRGLLVVSHEAVSPFLMWPGLTEDDYRDRMTDDQIRVLKASLGLSVVAVERDGADWRLVPDSRFTRRITLDTPIAIGGPCAGHPRMRTGADPEGRSVLGTMTNCNGGVTPWGTVLSGEEGCMDAFAGDYATLPDQDIVERQGWDEEDNDEYALSRIDPRFVFESEPNEWNRFDWVVELDPFDPEAPPVKRTALGRFTHEGAQVALAPDGRVVVYMADDDDFEYLYRFVSTGRYDAANRAANRDLLDDGVLSVARFEDDGSLTWAPLVYGIGPLTEANGFADQADVLFKTRMAADLLGATPMDGPEGFIPNPVTGRVYVAMTENEDRLPAGEGDPREQVNAANPRPNNFAGHVLELIPPGAPGAADHAADAFAWDIFALCGDPADPAQQARYHAGTSRNGWFVDPDNLGVDPSGRLWICTDGPPDAGFNDALYAADVEGEGKALSKLFYLPPMGSECCSPWFTPDGRSLFVSVQHPGELRWSDMDDATTLAEAGTRWPDFGDMPPRPSVVVLMREDGGPVGS